MCFPTRTACTAARSRRSGSYSASGTSAATGKTCREWVARCEPQKGCPVFGSSGTLTMHGDRRLDVPPSVVATLAAAFIALAASPACTDEPFDMAMVEQGRQIFETVA